MKKIRELENLQRNPLIFPSYITSTNNEIFLNSSSKFNSSLNIFFNFRKEKESEIDTKDKSNQKKKLRLQLQIMMSNQE